MELTRSETLELLDELEESLDNTDDVQDLEAWLEQIEFVFDSLEEASAGRVHEHLPQIRGWVEVLMNEEESEQLASVRTLVFEELAELREILGLEDPSG